MFIVYIAVSGYGKSCLDNVAISEELIKGFKSVDELAEYLKQHYVKQLLYPEYDIDKINVRVVRIDKGIDKRTDRDYYSVAVWEAD